MRFGVVLPIQDTRSRSTSRSTHAEVRAWTSSEDPKPSRGADHLPGRRGVLEDVVAYASQRHAFGKPTGQMQAIQHGIADIAMKLDGPQLHRGEPRPAPFVLKGWAS